MAGMTGGRTDEFDRTGLTRRRLCRVAGAFVLGLPFGFAAPARGQSVPPRLFGYREKMSRAMQPFIKWTGTLDRYFAERRLEDAPCTATRFNKCHLQDWKRFLAALNGRTRLSQIIAVHEYMNRAPYIIDPVNYGVADYWATPRQFFVKDGDCEDYAIAKYLSMRALGFPPGAMRIVILQDNNLRLMHAVLAVYIGRQIYILDNQINKIVTHDRIRHYRPIYSINEVAWWVHMR